MQQVEIDGQPVERGEARLAVGAIALARPSGTHAPPSRVIPPLVTIARARAAPRRAERRGQQPLVVPDLGRIATVGARGVEHRDAGFGRGRDGGVGARSSRSSSVDSRMQPRPMRSSVGASQSKGTGEA